MANNRIILLATPQHTGTHYMRLLLELHPNIQHVKMMVCEYNNVRLARFMVRYFGQKISYDELYNSVVNAEFRDGDIEFTHNGLKSIGIIPDAKSSPLPFIHTHIFWYNMNDKKIYSPPDRPLNEFDVVYTVRDPMLSFVTAFRRSPVPEITTGDILNGLKYIERYGSDGFIYATDLPEDRADAAIKVFDFLGLPHNDKCLKYVNANNPVNVTGGKDELLEAKRMILEEKKVPPFLVPYVSKIRRFNLQGFFESLGYKELVWFE